MRNDADARYSMPCEIAVRAVIGTRAAFESGVLSLLVLEQRFHQ